MRVLTEKLLETLKKLPRERAAHICVVAVSCVLCLCLTGVFANAGLSELKPVTVIADEVPPAAAAPAVDLSLYADLPDVQTIEYETRSETIQRSVKYVEDDTLYDGEAYLQTEGSDGVALVTTALVYINGELDYVHTAQTQVLVRPVSDVVVTGTKYRPVSTGNYVWPAGGTITSAFGPRSGAGSSDHKGLDIANDTGTPVYAADAGLVTRANSEYSGYGKLIWVQHDNGEVTYYAHLSDYAVSEGEYVEQGQLIGYMGSTGLSTGSHLHFEIRVGGEAVDPQLYLS